MRIVQAITNLNAKLGGTARAAIDLATAMAARGHQVDVLTSESAELPMGWGTTAGSNPRNIVDAGPDALLLSRSLGSAGLEAIRNADVVHLHAMWELFNIRVAALCRSLGVPYISTPHGMLDDWSMAQKSWKKRTHLTTRGTLMLERAAYVHCTARAELAQSKKWFPNGRGTVIANLMDLAPFAQLPGPELARAKFPQLAQAKVRLLFLGRVTPKKGLDFLIRALALLRAENLDANIIVVGNPDAGYAATLQSCVRAVGMQEHVHFLGHIDGALKVSVVEACDLLVIPSSQENFGFVFYEALACRTPIVTTNLVDTHAELHESGGATIVDRTSTSIAEGVREGLRNHAPNIACREAVRAWVFRICDPTVIATQFERMYVAAHGMRTLEESSR
ncbi:MAG: glycosyltransferase [Phycisphaerales bacterium]|nr:glycosyltransferase [Phycisphaerales bacterium]